jgi:3-deoxy-D-manno-octulosonic-acid transferase
MTNLIRLFYSIIFYLLVPVIILRLLVRTIKAPSYAQRWGERFGIVSTNKSGKDIIWLHAVSVGESLAAVPLVQAIQKKYPDQRVMLTCMTPTGSERIRASFGDSVDHCYAPYDMPGAVARFLNRVKPKVLIIMETELWPNTIAACHKRNIPVVLANARLSKKSALGYSRVKPLVKPMLESMTAVVAQHHDDGARFVDLGLPESRLSISGNIKFDLTLDAPLKQYAQQLGTQWRGAEGRLIWLAASTHRGEDEIILQAMSQIKAGMEVPPLLVLVPRHPERFDQVAELCTSAGYTLARHSKADATAGVDILLGDTMGELMAFYGACDIAFVGGSLVPTGGHNMIEPAAWGVPILTGPHLFNFAEASRLLLEAEAMQVCDNADSLAQHCIDLLNNQQQRQTMGDAGLNVAEDNRGALDRLLAEIANSL